MRRFLTGLLDRWLPEEAPPTKRDPRNFESEVLTKLDAIDGRIRQVENILSTCTAALSEIDKTIGSHLESHHADGPRLVTMRRQIDG
jgi:hypothetical protein